MKKVTEFLALKGFIFSDFRKIELQKLGTKKKIEVFSGCDIKNHFISIFIVNQKSRFVLKNALELDDLKEKLKILEEHNFKQNILLISSEMCSKSCRYLNNLNWTIYHDFV